MKKLFPFLPSFKNNWLNAPKAVLLLAVLFMVNTNVVLGQCTNATQYPSTASTAPAANAAITISTAQYYGGEYNRINSVVAGNTYLSSTTVSTTYITIHYNTYNGTVVAQGTTPLLWTAASAGTYYVHYNTNSSCGTSTSTMSSYLARLSSTTTTACSGNFYDDGGSAAAYTATQRKAYKFFPSTAGSKVSLTFSSFDTEAAYDGMFIFNGTANGSALIPSALGVGSNTFTAQAGSWRGHPLTGASLPKTSGGANGGVTSTASDGSLTIVFLSDGATQYAGWAAAISCYSPCTPPAAPTVSTITQTTCATATGSVLLTGLPGGGGTLTRSPGGTTYAATGTSYTVTGLPAGATYTFTVTSSTCATPSAASGNVVINAQPVVPTNPTISGTTSVCGGSTQTYTCTATGSSYTWAVPSGWVINSGQGSTSINVTAATGVSSGNISVYATNSCGNSGTVNYAVSAPWGANAGSDFTSCSGSNLSGSYTGTLNTATLFSETFETYTNGLITSSSSQWRSYVISGFSAYTWWAMSSTCAITGSRSMSNAYYDGYFLYYCDYQWDGGTDMVSYNINPVNATGYTNLKLNFKWKSYGEPDDGFNSGQPYDYGRVVYSTNGTTWVPVNSTKYYGQSSTQTVINLDLSALNGTTFYLGFEWVNDNNTGTNPPFVIDDISITGTPSAAYAWSGPSFSSSSQNPAITNGGTYTLSVTSLGCVSTDQVVVTMNTASVPPTGISGNPGTTITCGSSTILSATGGTIGTGAAAVFYAGDACLAGGYTQDWTSWAYGTQYNMNMNSVAGGILNVTSTGNDPMIDMAGLGSFNPATFRYVNIKYRVTAGTGGVAEIFFYNTPHNYAFGGESATGALISDGNWRVLTIDMWNDPDYLTGGNILGWRFDWASNSGVTMDIDYVTLTSTPPLTSSTVAPTTNTTYYVRYEGNCNVTTCASQLVTVNPLAAPTVGTVVQPTCAIATGSIELTGLPAGTWTLTPSTGSPVTSTGSSYTFATLSAGITYTFTVSQGSCTSAATSGVAINAQPPTPGAPTLAVTNNCGSSILTVSNYTGSLTWSDAGTGNPRTVISGTFTVTQTVGGCTSSSSNSVTANPTVSSAPTLAVTNNCNNSTITASNYTGTLTWSDAGTGNPRSVTSGSFTVTQTISGCVSPASNSVTANPTAPAAPTLAVTNNCGNSTITASGFTGSLTWSDAGTGNPRTVTSGSFTVTQTVGGCTSSSSNSVTANPTPVPGAPTLGIVNNCGNSTVTASNFSGILTWSDAGSGNPRTITSGSLTVTQTLSGCTSANSNQVTANPISIPGAPTLAVTDNCGNSTLTVSNYTGSLTWSDAGTGNPRTVTNSANFTVTQTVSGCTSANSNQVTSNPLAKPADAVASVTAQPTCTVPSGTFTVTSPATAANIRFSIDGSTYTNATGVFTLVAPGTYTVTGKNTTSGCVSNSTSVTVNAIPSAPSTPVAAVTQPTCAVPSGIITITSPTGAAYEYSLDGGTYQSSAIFNGVAIGGHTVTARLAASPTCISSASGTLTVNSTPSPISPITPVNVCQGGTGVLVATNNCVNNYVIPTITNSIYGGWMSSGDPTAAVPSGVVNTTTCSFTGPVRTYSIVPFQVSVTGNYVFEMNNNTTYNGVGYIYTGSFTPGSCATGTLVRADNDEGSGDEPILGGSNGAGAMSLSAGVTYYLVSSTQGASDVTGNDYTWTITPSSGGNVMLNEPGNVEWYTASSGGSAIGTGNSFNPVGVSGSGISNTNSLGTWTFWAACSSSPSCRTQADFTITTIASTFNVTPASSTCFGTSVNIGLSGSTSGYPYQLYIDGVATGSPVAGTGSALSFGSPTAIGTYTAAVHSGSCDIPMNGSVEIKPVPVANAGSDVTLPCNGSIGLTGSSNNTTLFTENFGTNVNTQLSSSVNAGWKIKYLYGTEPANRTEWWISYYGATPYSNYDQPSNSFPLSGSALMLIDHRIYQSVVGADYAWDAGTTDEIGYNTTLVDARLYTSVNLSFNYRVGGTFSGSNVYDYMQVVYSLDNGTSWTALNEGNASGSYTLYRQMSGTTNAFFSHTANTPATGTAIISMPPAVVGQKFLLGFRWVNDGNLTGAFVGGPVIDNISVTGAASYSWSPTAGVTGANTATPTITQPGTYTVVVTAGNGCSASDDVVVTGSSPVTINPFSPASSTRCPGAATITYSTTANNSTGITYSLDATTAAFAGNSINALTGAVTFAAGWNGTTTITASAAGCGGPATTTHVVTTGASVTYGSIASADETLCPNSTGNNPANITFSTAPTGSAFTYQWYFKEVTGVTPAAAPALGSGISGWSIASGATGSSYDPPAGNIPNGACRTYACFVTPTCGSADWAGSARKVIVDVPLSQTAAPDDCLNMSTDNYSTAITNYYVVVSATGGTSPLSFPVTDLVGTINSNTKVYEQLDGSTLTYPVTDALGCVAGSSFNVSVPSGPPTDIAQSSWIGPGTASTTRDCYDFGYNKWVTYRDGNNDAILAINAATNDLGLVTVSMYRNDNEPVVLNSSWGNGNCYQVPMRPMERHFVVTTSNAPPVNGYTQKAKVRLFFTQTELNDLITETYGVGGSSNWDTYCSTDDDVTGLADLFVTKYTAPSGFLSTEDGDYSNNKPQQQGGIYRLFGDALTLPGNGPLTRDGLGTFNAIYGGANTHHYVEMQVTEFSEFWLHGSGHSTPLPVQMIFLEANAVNNAFIQLTWATALEINNDGFQVERSSDGQNWTQIGFVNGHDNATTQNDYSYNDMNVTAGIVYYYRLKQVDNDGAFEYTDIVSAKINGDVSFSVKDFVPNPTMDRTSLIVTATKDQDITVAFYNVVGQKVMESSHLLNKGGNTISFDLSKLASGTYTAIVSSANEVYTKKVVLAR